MGKYRNSRSGAFRSNLEGNCAKMLEAENIQFGYETEKFVLQDKAKLDNPVLEKGKFVTSLRAITYTPDFIGKDWIIETKGQRTPDFNIKWKMFLKNIDIKCKIVCMASNKLQISECINLIKDGKGVSKLHKETLQRHKDSKSSATVKRSRRTLNVGSS